jgi:hypothetical protein
MENITEEFINIVRCLNAQGVFPIVYGSLGLYFALGKNGKVNDIDFIINNQDEFNTSKQALFGYGFESDPDHTRELLGENYNVSFINRTDIEQLIEEPLELEKKSMEGADFFNLPLAQYHKIYAAGLRQPDRLTKKEADDLDKLKVIEEAQN